MNFLRSHLDENFVWRHRRISDVRNIPFDRHLQLEDFFSIDHQQLNIFKSSSVQGRVTISRNDNSQNALH